VAVLPDNRREVVTVLKVDGLSLEEIASVTASTTGAVKQKAHRAYERLRRILERATKGPEQTPPPQSASTGLTQ
jgi:RNA polymerase sigma-70 factor (ECF subfamily)